MKDFTLEDVISAADELIVIRIKLIAILKDGLDKIGSQRTKINACKTVFSSYSILGTVALFTPAAPLAPALIGGGIAGSLVGSIGDCLMERKVQNEVHELLEKERPYAERLEDMLMRLKEHTSEVATYHSMDYDTAAQLVVRRFALGGFKGVVCMTKRGSIPTANASGKVVSKIGTSSNIVGLTAAKILAKPGAQTAGKIFKNALGPISIGLDVADIIHTWNSDAPGVKDVKEVIEKLEGH